MFIVLTRLIRMKKTLPYDWYRMMLHALSELLYSPVRLIVIVFSVVTFIHNYYPLSVVHSTG